MRWNDSNNQFHNLTNAHLVMTPFQGWMNFYLIDTMGFAFGSTHR